MCNSVACSKDVDGFSFFNLGRLVQGSLNEKGVFVPCTALAVAEIIKVKMMFLIEIVTSKDFNDHPYLRLTSLDQPKGYVQW